MKKSRLLIIIYIISIIVLSFPIIIRESKADVVYIDYAGTGNFLPEENILFIMTNASVIFNVDAKTYLSRINIDFTGNYTIHNPSESMNVTLVAPFSSNFKDLESSCLIKIENTTVSYDFLDYNFTDSPWEEYLDWRYFESRKFIIINATFPENDSITIEYNFGAHIDIRESSDVLNILYDVGTSRAWNGTITERVEFKVYGKRPDSYSTYRKDSFEYNCTISEIEDGISYAWEGENEIINVNSVYISYSYINTWWRMLGRILPLILFPSVIGGLIVSMRLIRRRANRKARRELYRPN